MSFKVLWLTHTLQFRLGAKIGRYPF